MFRNRRVIILIAILVLVALYGLYVFAAGTIRPLKGVGGEPAEIGLPSNYHYGTFRYSDGNVGTIEFGLAPFSGGGLYPRAALVSDENGYTLSGYFWIGTVGYVSLENVELIPTGGSATDPYSLSGYIWSDHAGWMDLSRVRWLPDINAFSGYAWNDGIGWVNMSGASIADINVGLVGKVKILGALSSSRVVDTTYSIQSSAIQSTSNSTNTAINAVRKNITIILRNLPSGSINTDFSTTSPVVLNDKFVFINTGSTTKHVTYGSGNIEGYGSYPGFANTPTGSNPVRSLIVMGGDVYIDKSVIPNSDGHPRAIIAMKNDQGVGGNIYIYGDAGVIRSSLVAEGSIYSGYFPSTASTLPITYNATSTGLLALPPRQMYILGSIISHNTIGGGYGRDSNYICPYTEADCDAETSIHYDLNYFRDFQKTSSTPVILPSERCLYDEQKKIENCTQSGTSDLCIEATEIMTQTCPVGYPFPANIVGEEAQDLPNPNRSYKNSTFDDYSMVIEYDTRILSDPPPGLATVK